MPPADQKFYATSDPAVLAAGGTAGANAATLALINTVAQTITVDMRGARYFSMAFANSGSSAFAVAGTVSPRGALKASLSALTIASVTAAGGVQYVTVGPLSVATIVLTVTPTATTTCSYEYAAGL